MSTPRYVCEVVTDGEKCKFKTNDWWAWDAHKHE